MGYFLAYPNVCLEGSDNTQSMIATSMQNLYTCHHNHFVHESTGHWEGWLQKKANWYPHKGNLIHLIHKIFCCSHHFVSIHMRHFGMSVTCWIISKYAVCLLRPNGKWKAIFQIVSSYLCRMTGLCPKNLSIMLWLPREARWGIRFPASLDLFDQMVHVAKQLAWQAVQTHCRAFSYSGPHSK